MGLIKTGILMWLAYVVTRSKEAQGFALSDIQKLEAQLAANDLKLPVLTK